MTRCKQGTDNYSRQSLRVALSLPLSHSARPAPVREIVCFGSWRHCLSCISCQLHIARAVSLWVYFYSKLYINAIICGY